MICKYRNIYESFIIILFFKNDNEVLKIKNPYQITFDKGFKLFDKKYYLLNTDCTIAFGTISSLNVYAPVFSDFIQRTTFVNSLSAPFCNDATTFFAIVYNYLISL